MTSACARITEIRSSCESAQREALSMAILNQTASPGASKILPSVQANHSHVRANPLAQS